MVGRPCLAPYGPAKECGLLLPIQTYALNTSLVVAGMVLETQGHGMEKKSGQSAVSTVWFSQSLESGKG
jgi:hypothetical protein